MGLMLSAALREALAGWLAHLKALDGASANTLRAYESDVGRFLSFLAAHHGERLGARRLAETSLPDMRAFLADTRGRGVSARSAARILSSVKGFYRWWAEREGVDPTAVLSVRSPRYQRKLPRPLSEDAARTVLGTVGDTAREDWIAARDALSMTALCTVAAGYRGRLLPEPMPPLPRCCASAEAAADRAVLPARAGLRRGLSGLSFACRRPLAFRGARRRSAAPQSARAEMGRARRSGFRRHTCPPDFDRSCRRGRSRAIQELLGPRVASDTGPIRRSMRHAWWRPMKRPIPCLSGCAMAKCVKEGSDDSSDQSPLRSPLYGDRRGPVHACHGRFTGQMEPDVSVAGGRAGRRRDRQAHSAATSNGRPMTVSFWTSSSTLSTYVFIPAFALFRSASCLDGPAGWRSSSSTYASAIYFVDTRMKTKDNSFAGFRPCWNMVVLVLFGA